MKSTILSITLILCTAITAQVGIGTTNPAPGVMLDVIGTGKMTGFIMPTGATEGGVLTSDANGNASWRTATPTAINTVVGTLSTNGVNIPAATTNFLQTGGYIDLPPGKFAVNVTMLIRTLNVAITPPNSSIWLRSTFSDVNTANPQPSNDIPTGKLISGSLSGSSYYGLVNGSVLINNTSTGTKRYYFVGGRLIINSTSQTLEAFGSSTTDENRIIAYRIN